MCTGYFIYAWLSVVLFKYSALTLHIVSDSVSSVDQKTAKKKKRFGRQGDVSSWKSVN